MKKFLFIYYPKCTTCQKAKKWLEEHHIDYDERHIVENRPNVEELKHWVSLSNKELKSFFNTSGLKYKSLQLKDKLPQMNDDEKYTLLASDGMLVKRPLLIGSTSVCTGFKDTEWLKVI